MKISKEFKIGLFTVVMIAGGWVGTKFLSGVDLFRSTNDYYVEYEDVDGVQKSSDVVVRGVKVGSVTDMTFDPKVSEKIILTLSIERTLEIPIDTRALITGSGMMSAKSISLKLGKSEEYLSDGDQLIAVDGVDLISKLTGDVELFRGRLDTLTTNLNRTLVNVNTLLESNNEDLTQMVSNLEGITAKVNNLLLTEQENLKRSIKGVADFSETLGAGSGKIDSILTNVEALTSQLNKADVGGKLSSSLGELEKSLKAINNQSGSAGKIIYDKALYENLEASTKSLDMLLTDLRENPKRYVHFSVFGTSNEKEAERRERDSLKQAKKR